MGKERNEVVISGQQRGRLDLEEFSHMFAANIVRFDHVWKPMDRHGGYAMITLPEPRRAHSVTHATSGHQAPLRKRQIGRGDD
jgi:hypothetical protein